MSISLYVHIPFCLKRCSYCDFVSGIYELEKETVYIEAIKKEILDIPDDTLLSTLYIGGGTPTVLSTEGITDLIAHIFKNFSFEKNYEATIEANPGTVDREKLTAILASRINRLSIGVQSFNDSELELLGRMHKSGDAENTVLLARDVGFQNIGIDLIYGIPGQDMGNWKKTLEKTISLKPQHISTYELTVEEGTLLHEYINETFISQKDVADNENYPSPTPLPQGEGVRGRVKDALPPKNRLNPLSEDEIIEMYNYAIDYLKTAGFIHYEISNFAMPGYSCRHNLNYWQRGEYFGVGVGAASFIKGKRFRNTAEINDYITSTLSSKSPVKESEELTENQTFSEAVFLGLRKTEGINLETFAQNYRRNLLDCYRPEIEELQNTGLLEIRDNHLRLTRKGLILSNEVFKRFM